MDNFKHHVLAGKGDSGVVFVTIKLTDGRLSITGVEGPKSNGDCTGSCGQCREAITGIKFKPAWDVDCARLYEVWNEWHLNELTAGSPAQTAFLKANPIEGHLDHYNSACAALTLAGLNPDAGYIHKGEPYRYGTAWLRRTVPEEVLEFLHALPQTDLLPACWAS